MKVLIVDASIVVRERLLEDLLADLAHIEVVGQAKNAEEGREFVRRLKPDVVILDVLLPKGSGTDLLTEIKRANPQAKAIVLTNYSDPNTRRRCVALGADRFLSKATELARVGSVLRALSPPPNRNAFRPRFRRRHCTHRPTSGHLRAP